MFRQLTESMPTYKKPESERFKGPAKYAEYLVAQGAGSGEQGAGSGDLLRAEGGNGLRAEGGNLKPENATASQPPLRFPTYARATADRQVSGLIPHTPTQVSSLRFQPSKSLKPHPSLELAAQVRAVFLRAGANLFSGFTFNRMSPELAARHIEIEGIEHLKAALKEGKGVIVLLAHMGPWEALTQLPQFAQSHGIHAPFGAMYRPLNNTFFERLV